ncbi:hypothetical protein HOY80DRAFT_1056654 [Tuber brumale]|nr:hypothetical protein HOY80DRAFT_1056654 [Tuber brumale]
MFLNGGTCCARALMAKEPDFKAQRSRLEEENGQGGGLGSYLEFVEHLSISEVSRTGEGVAVKVLIYNELARGSGGQADDVAFLSWCGEWVGTLAERLGRTEELGEVWELVGGGSNEKAKADATMSDDAEAAKSRDAKVGRLMEDNEHGLFVVDSWKKSVVNDLTIQETPMTGMIVGDLRRENSKVRQIRLQQAQGSTADQPFGNHECFSFACSHVCAFIR